MMNFWCGSRSERRVARPGHGQNLYIEVDDLDIQMYPRGQAAAAKPDIPQSLRQPSTAVSWTPWWLRRPGL
jgi:hypothetical protein